MNKISEETVVNPLVFFHILGYILIVGFPTKKGVLLCLQ